MQQLVNTSSPKQSDSGTFCVLEEQKDYRIGKFPSKTDDDCPARTTAAEARDDGADLAVQLEMVAAQQLSEE
jgi:hypothetical protein